MFGYVDEDAEESVLPRGVSLVNSDNLWCGALADATLCSQLITPEAPFLPRCPGCSGGGGGVGSLEARRMARHCPLDLIQMIFPHRSMLALVRGDYLAQRLKLT